MHDFIWIICKSYLHIRTLSVYLCFTEKINQLFAQYINRTAGERKKCEPPGSQGGPVMNTFCVLPSSSFSLSRSSPSSGLLLIWSPPLSTGAMIHVVPTGPHSPHTDTAQSSPPLSICPSVSACSPSLCPQASQPAVHIGPPWPALLRIVIVIVWLFCVIIIILYYLCMEILFFH